MAHPLGNLWYGEVDTTEEEEEDLMLAAIGKSVPTLLRLWKEEPVHG